MNLFRSLPDYEAFIYSLSEQFASIQHSTLVIARRGPRFAILQGEVQCATELSPAIFREGVRDNRTYEAIGDPFPED